MPAGKVNECNCAEVLPFLSFHFFAFFLFRSAAFSQFRLTHTLSLSLATDAPPASLRHSRVRQSLLTYRYTHGYDAWSDRISKVRVSHERTWPEGGILTRYREVNVNVSLRRNYSRPLVGVTSANSGVK